MTNYLALPVPEDRICTFLANELGETDALGEYTTPTEFFYEAEADHETVLTSLMVTITGKKKPKTDRYGGLKKSLPNGYSILIKDPAGATALDLTAGNPIKENGDLAQHTFHLNVGVWDGGDKSVIALFRFRPATRFREGYRISVTLNDDFQKLSDHTFRIEGYRLFLP